MDRIVQITCLGKKGRLGNQFFQYAFARGYAQKHRARLEKPAWIGQELFALNDPRPNKRLPKTQLDEVPDDGRINIDLNGYFCWSGNHSRYPWTVEEVRNWFRFTTEAMAKYTVGATRLRYAMR